MKTNSKEMDSCTELLKEQSKFYLSVLSTYFHFYCVWWTTNIYLLEVHNHDTRFANNFHLSSNHLTKYQKGAHYAGIKILIHLPTHINYVANEIHVYSLALILFYW